jgi:uncharacterized SAM-binding protein YcdF (DUF218 family)
VARRVGVVLLALAWLMSCRPFVEVVLRPLEDIYQRPTLDELRRREVRDIVVLTGGGHRLQGELLSSALPHASAYRFLGGIELCALLTHLGRDCRLVFSGSAGRDDRGLGTAEIMHELARRCLPEAEIVSEVRSGSSAEHPENVRPLLRSTQSFLLVTSDYHMPRAVRYFHRAGLEPIPFPVDSFARGDTSWSDWLPSAESFWILNVGLREYSAWILYAVNGFL